MENIIDLGQEFSNIFLQWQLKTCAKDPIEQNIGRLDCLRQLLEGIFLGKDFSACLEKAFDKIVFLALDEIGTRLPALRSKCAHRHQCITAIIARPNQTEDF